MAVEKRRARPMLAVVSRTTGRGIEEWDIMN